MIPALEKRLTSNKSNYRPISLLTIFSKSFEKLIYKRLYRLLAVSESLLKLQFGLRSEYSTDLALVSLTENIKTSLGNNRFGCGISIDRKKILTHDSLQSKLEHYGIRGSSIAWFKSYHSDPGPRRFGTGWAIVLPIIWPDF